MIEIKVMHGKFTPSHPFSIGVYYERTLPNLPTSVPAGPVPVRFRAGRQMLKGGFWGKGGDRDDGIKEIERIFRKEPGLL